MPTVPVPTVTRCPRCGTLRTSPELLRHPIGAPHVATQPVAVVCWDCQVARERRAWHAFVTTGRRP